MRVRRHIALGELLAGDADALWRGFPVDSRGEEVLDAFEEGLTTLLASSVAAADERITEAWRREPAVPGTADRTHGRRRAGTVRSAPTDAAG